MFKRPLKRLVQNLPGPQALKFFEVANVLGKVNNWRSGLPLTLPPEIWVHVLRTFCIEFYLETFLGEGGLLETGFKLELQHCGA